MYIIFWQPLHDGKIQYRTIGVNFHKDSTEVQRGENFLHCTVNSQYLEPSIT